MFKLIVLTVAIACIAAAPPAQAPTKDGEATIVSNTSSDDGVGNFAYAFETSNKIKADAKGSLKQLKGSDGNDAPGEVQEGSYSWTDASGQTYEVKWIADENGFQPQGAHLPTPPPAPKA